MMTSKTKKKSSSKLKSVIKTPEIEFLCHTEDVNVIPEPYPARKLVPDWYKTLPPKINKENKLENSTIKRCAPFLDAMCVGWIIPLAADVEIVTNDDASGFTWKSKFYRPMIESHTKEQIGTIEKPNPESPKPPMKFLNHWLMRVPKDYSILFVPPLNRNDFRFECISGMVDCDGYFEFINFPFFFKEKNFTGIVSQGTPLVQAIPIKRSTLFNEYVTRPISEKDQRDLELTRRKRLAHESYYRDSIWKRK